MWMQSPQATANLQSNFVVDLYESKQEAVVMEQENERLRSGHGGGYVKKNGNGSWWWCKGGFTFSDMVVVVVVVVVVYLLCVTDLRWCQHR